MIERRTAWAVALVATLTLTVSYVDRTTLGVLGPSVSAALGISNTEFGLLGSAFSFAYLFATPICGWWIDRIGARRGLVGSVLAWSSVAALHALVPGFAVLFVLRLALGIAEGPGFPGAAQTVQRILPAADRERGFGVLFTGSSIGAMLVPPLAAFLYSLAGWRVAFLGTAVAGLAWVPLWLWVTRRSEVRAQLDVEAGKRAAGATFGELVASPIMIRALLAIFAVAPLIGFVQQWGAKYLALTFEVAQGDVGDYLWLPALAFDAGAVVFGDLASRQQRDGRPPRLLGAVAAVLAACIATLPLAGTPWQATALAAVAMVGGGATYTLVTADMLGRMPRDCISLAGGILAGAQSLSLIASSPLIGQAVDRFGSYVVVVVGLGVWVLPGTIAWLVWTPAARFERAVMPAARVR